MVVGSLTVSRKVANLGGLRVIKRNPIQSFVFFPPIDIRNQRMTPKLSQLMIFK